FEGRASGAGSLDSIREMWKIRREERVTMSRPTLASVVTIDPDVTFRELGGEIVILNLETGVYFGLDQWGARIWRPLESPGAAGLVGAGRGGGGVRALHRSSGVPGQGAGGAPLGVRRCPRRARARPARAR